MKSELKDLQAIFAKAAAFEKNGMLVEAARSYRLFLAKYPEPSAHYNYAAVLKRMKRLDEAMLQYEKAIALKPDYAEAYANIGGICMERAEYEKSLSQYETAIRYNPRLFAAHYNRGVVLQKLGRPDDALAAYIQALTLNPQFYPAALNAGSIYLESQAFEKAIEQYSAAIQHQPMLPQAYCGRGVVLQKSGRPDDALRDYHQALKLQPDYAEAHIYAGNVHFETGAFQKALEAYDLAIRHGPEFAEAYYNRGVVLQELRRHGEALADNEKALALDPDHHLALLNKTILLSEMKRKPEAFLHYEQMLRRNPDNHRASWNLGLLKLSEGDFAEGWRLYETRLQLQRNPAGDQRIWQGKEALSGKTVLVRWEQGFGDTIQFCRYAVLLKNAGANVILAVQDPLRRLIASLDKGVAVVGEDRLPEHFDYQCQLMSLPNALGTTVATIPQAAKYLHVDAAEVARWSACLRDAEGVKVGLVWAGGQRPHLVDARRSDSDRSLTLQHYLPLLGVRGAVFVSLQKGPPAAQLDALPGVMRDWTAALGDFAETGALIENLDLVITVDTAVAHLAAALGKPTWILIAFRSCWRWLEGRTDSPWYSSVRLFRQSEPGNWDSVIGQVKQALESLAAVGLEREFSNAAAPD